MEFTELGAYEQLNQLTELTELETYKQLEPNQLTELTELETYKQLEPNQLTELERFGEGILDFVGLVEVIGEQKLEDVFSMYDIVAHSWGHRFTPKKVCI